MRQSSPLTFTDCRIDPNALVDRSNADGWIFLEGIEPWEMAPHALAFAKLGRCPICRGRRLARSRYCLGCDRCGMDGRASFPGLPVGKYLDPEWTAEPTVYAPGDDLAGGVGKQVKIRRGIARSRKAG